MIFDDIIYVSATSLLLAGSTLEFDSERLSSYFFVSGSGLFLLKSSISLIKSINKYRRYKRYKNMSVYDRLL